MQFPASAFFQIVIAWQLTVSGTPSPQAAVYAPKLPSYDLHAWRSLAPERKRAYLVGAIHGMQTVWLWAYEAGRSDAALQLNGLPDVPKSAAYRAMNGPLREVPRFSKSVQQYLHELDALADRYPKRTVSIDAVILGCLEEIAVVKCPLEGLPAENGRPR